MVAGQQGEVEYWDDTAKEINGYVKNIYFENKRKGFLRLINKWGNDKINKKILKVDLYEEAISRDSAIAFLLAKRGDVTGMDISSEIVKFAKKNCKEKVKFLVQDVRNMKAFKDNTFDLVLSYSTLDHIIEVDDALKEMYRVLKPKGTLIVTINNRTNLFFEFARIMAKIFGSLVGAKYIYESYSFDVWEFKKMISNAGFDIEDSTGILYFYPMMGTAINWAYKRNIKVLKYFFEVYVNFFESIGRRETWLNYFIGGQIAVKAVKS